MTRRSKEDRQQKREFRMNLVNRIKDLSPQERAKVVEEIIQSSHVIPFSKKRTLSKTTIYRWLGKFRMDGNGDSLMGKVRKDRNEFRALSQEQMKALLVWRSENAYRSGDDLRDELVSHDNTCRNPPSTATIIRFLRANELSRDSMILATKTKSKKIRLAYEAEYPNRIWVADTKGPDIWVKDPRDPARRVQAKPTGFIDDYARYMTAAHPVIVENEAAIMELFGEAILLYGIPDILHVDWGPAFSGKSLKRAAALIGCTVIHAPKRDPSAKGKIERLFETLNERLERELQVSGRDVLTVEEYDQYLQAYLSQDYHKKVHSSTGQTPEERYFAFPNELRRWISKESLYLIFLPCRTAKVSKTGLVRINKLDYLVPDPALFGKKVEVRSKSSEPERIHVWYDDKYYGEANLYLTGNDFLQREAIMERLKERIEINVPPRDEVPGYGRLERQLAKYREEMQTFDINEQLAQFRQKKEQVRAALLPGKSNLKPGEPVLSALEFNAEAFVYLLMKLLRRKFTPSERLAVHTLWNSAGPIEEKLVRQTVGRLLGEEHPVDDLQGYLEEIRLAVITKHHN